MYFLLLGISDKTVNRSATFCYFAYCEYFFGCANETSRRRLGFGLGGLEMPRPLVGKDAPKGHL